MKPIVRSTILFFAMVFLGGAVFAWFDVLTHDNILTNPELKFATGWLMTGLMFLGLGMRGWRWRKAFAEDTARHMPRHPARSRRIHPGSSGPALVDPATTRRMTGTVRLWARGSGLEAGAWRLALGARRSRHGCAAATAATSRRMTGPP